MADITLRRVADFAALEAPWRALEQRSDASFFQGWTWTGCLATTRYTDPVLLEVRDGGPTVALALFNRHPTRLAPATLLLGETGEPQQDAVFVEHNAPLLAVGCEDLLEPCLRAAIGGRLPSGGPRHGRAVVLSGVGTPVLEAARRLPGMRLERRSRVAPFVDLGSLSADVPYPAALGASTRYQLRRSERRYADSGTLAVRRAGDVAEGLQFLEALAALHQASWTSRGQPGAFVNPEFSRFHRELVARRLPRGEIDLLRISTGDRAIGYLYNFIRLGWVGNYQSGFDYDHADAHQKPGLTCHHLAIEFYRAESRSAYDFLAGEDRYKANLATAQIELHWLELMPIWSPRALAMLGRSSLSAAFRRTRSGVAH